MDFDAPPPRPVAPPPPPPPAVPPARAAGSRIGWLLGMLVLLLMMWMLPYFAERVQYAITRGRERAAVDVAREQLPSAGLTEISRQFAVIAKAIGPSVVHIDTVQVADREGELASFGGRQSRSIGQGSGVIVDEGGYILTNHHVVAGARAIQVKLANHQTRPARVVGLDETTDLAVLKIDSNGLIAAPWGDSDALEVGSLVWAVGNPFGLDRSVTQGIISAKNRRGFQGSSPYQDFLQSDAAVNPGNSGGPLVDVSGQIVGINTAIVGRAYQGVSFSIPASIAKEVYQRLRENGKVIRGYMGVQLAEVTAELAEQLGVGERAGAVVARVGRDTPADKAGLRREDVIVAFNKQRIQDPTELTLLVGKTPIGASVPVEIIRAGEKMTVDLTVEERPVDL